MTADSTSLDVHLVSVLVPISERHDDLRRLFYAHSKVLDSLNIQYEFIFVLDGDFAEAENCIRALKQEKPDQIQLIKFSRWQGEAKALSAAFSKSSGELILTLSAYFQVEPEEIAKLFESFNDDIDVVFGSRFPRQDKWVNRLQSKIFHWIISSFTKEPFNDISCGVRLIRRNVLEKISLYGDLHRFIPLLAINKGFNVKEISLQQAKEDFHLRIYRPGVYVRRLLDILTLFFLIKFTQKPLRFFGLLGGGISLVGLMISAVTLYQRLFSSIGLSERPLFLVGVLLALIGLQTFFIGLVGEIIIFTHMTSDPDYKIEVIIE